MATNQTTNYQLNQWEPTDPVLRTDFNADNAKLDTALQNQADSLTTLTAAVSSNTSALSGKGNCQVYSTSYTGAGTSSCSVSLPGYPMFVMVSGGNHCLWGIRGSSFGLSFNQYGQGTNLSFSWSSQSVSWSAPNSNKDFACNTLNTTYYVLALLQKQKEEVSPNHLVRGYSLEHHGLRRSI